jgi:hypothetical protein
MGLAPATCGLATRGTSGASAAQRERCMDSASLASTELLKSTCCFYV